MDSLSDPQHYMPNETRLAKIQAEIAGYNAERPAIQRQAYIQVGLYMGAYALVLLFFVYLLLHSSDHSKHNPLGFVVAVVAACGWWVWGFAWQPVKDYQLGLRYRLFPVVFGFIDRVEYAQGRAPAGLLADIKSMKLVRFSHSENDDLISGTHDGLSFEMVESRLQVGSGKDRTTVFRGLIFRFPVEPEFPGLLVAARRGNLVQEWVHDTFGGNEDTIASDDAEIDAAYAIHTDNERAARAIVEGTLIAALKYLKRNWQSGDARIALRGRECFLLLPADRDYFHVPSILQDVDYRQDVEPMIRDMVVLLAIAHLISKVGVAGGKF